jgi:DNA-binding SARP family transcriptional activator
MKGVPLPKYRLALVGRFQLSRSDGPVELPNRKLAALLAYLACTAPEPQSREKLATLAWGSHFGAQARLNLRQAVFRLRRTLGEDALISDGDDVSLAPSVLDCDVARLKTLIREGSRASLAAAVDLYRGRFLSDVSIPEEAWADWVTGERQRRRDRRSMPWSGSGRSSWVRVTRIKRWKRPTARWRSIICVRMLIA